MSSRISFAAGGFVAAFLVGVLLVASLACEGGSPSSSTGSGATGPCNAFLGAYVIASQDGIVSTELVQQTGTVTGGTIPETTTLPATQTGWANLIVFAYELVNSPGNNTNCSQVKLIAPAPNNDEYLLLNFGTIFSPNTLIAEDVTTFYNAHSAGAYIIEVSTDTAKCPGTATTLSNAWLNVVDTTAGSCCDCYSLTLTCSPFPAPESCCWGKGDWGMSVVLDPAGVIDTDTNTADILVLLSPVPYGGVPGDLFYVFSASLDCSTGVFSGTDDVLCASIDGTINSAGGSSGTLTLEDCSSKALCTSGWNDNPLGDEVCDWDTECFLCEPLGTPLGTSDDASASPQLRESPVLQRLRMGR